MVCVVCEVCPAQRVGGFRCVVGVYGVGVRESRRGSGSRCISGSDYDFSGQFRFGLWCLSSFFRVRSGPIMTSSMLSGFHFRFPDMLMLFSACSEPYNDVFHEPYKTFRALCWILFASHSLFWGEVSEPDEYFFYFISYF